MLLSSTLKIIIANISLSGYHLSGAFLSTQRRYCFHLFPGRHTRGHTEDTEIPRSAVTCPTPAPAVRGAGTAPEADLAPRRLVGRTASLESLKKWKQCVNKLWDEVYFPVLRGEGGGEPWWSREPGWVEGEWEAVAFWRLLLIRSTRRCCSVHSSSACWPPPGCVAPAHVWRSPVEAYMVVCREVSPTLKDDSGWPFMKRHYKVWHGGHISSFLPCGIKEAWLIFWKEEAFLWRKAD